MVLVDPSGVLYEIVGVNTRGDGVTHVWLWPDVSPIPDHFQEFAPDEEVNFISQSPVVDTIDLVAEVNADEPIEGGAAE